MGTCQGNNVKMSHGKCSGKNAQMSQDKSAEMFHVNNVETFHANNVTTFPDSNAEMSQKMYAKTSQDNNVETSQGKSANKQDMVAKVLIQPTTSNLKPNMGITSPISILTRLCLLIILMSASGQKGILFNCIHKCYLQTAQPIFMP